VISSNFAMFVGITDRNTVINVKDVKITIILCDQDQIQFSELRSHADQSMHGGNLRVALY